MGKIGEFDTDSQALARRIKAHEKYGSEDINQWIFDKLDLEPGLTVLDLGCGTGKQAIPLAREVGASGRVAAVDASRESLDTLFENAVKQGVSDRVSVLESRFDDLADQLPENRYDRMLASYSLYYVTDAEKLFHLLESKLNPRGILFFCGPSKGNNIEIKQFHYHLLGKAAPPDTKAAVFMEETSQKLVKKTFQNLELFTFENPLLFNSAEALYNYWSSYNLFDSKIDSRFKEAAARHFQTNSFFKTVKRAIGIKCIKSA